MLRQYLTKESEKEVAKTNLLALLVANSIPFNDQNASSEWERKIRKIFTTYMGLEYGFEMPEHSEKEIQMTQYYTNKVKKLKPILRRDDKGRFVVSGLDSLKE